MNLTVSMVVRAQTDRVLDTKTIKLCLSETAPDVWCIDRLCELSGTINRDDVFDQNIDCVTVRLRLFIDLESFFVETRVDCNIGDFRSIVVVEFFDIISYTRAVGFDGGENQQVLQVLIFTERRRFQDDLFE